MTTYTYLPWVRRGLIGVVIASSLQSGRIKLAVKADISGGSGASTEPVNILLFGPGDVTGFDTRQIIRTDPPHLTSDFEPNYFPLVEFDQPEFLWMFTPGVPNNQQLLPWICLIVVEKREGVKIIFNQAQPLPVLSIATDAHKELPDLSEAWAWAHAQVTLLNSEADPNQVMANQSEHTLGRLLCPRHLKPKTAYHACVVPTYLGGVQAGLGEKVIDGTAANLAWMLGANAPDSIRLPVYYHWEFATGALGDFEALVWQLERRQLSIDDVGTRELDISHAGYGLPANAPVGLGGTLRPKPEQEDESPIGLSISYQQRLQALLNETAVPPLPILPPPIYGKWHAGQRTIPDTISPSKTRDRPWLRAINLDPRFRVAAGLGAQVVRDQQEQLMASAWDQVGEIEHANQIIRQAQLARAASTTIHTERFGGLNPGSFLLVTAPVHPRVRYSSAQTNTQLTGRGHIQSSRLSVSVTSAQFRRAIRPRGIVARRFGISQPSTMISRLNDGSIRPVPYRPPTPDGMVTMRNLIRRDPCQISPLPLAQALLSQWSLEQLIRGLDSLLTIFEGRQSEFEQFDDKTQELLKQIEQYLAEARQLLGLFAAQYHPASGTSLRLILSLYKPALAFIAEAQLLAIRLNRHVTVPRPDIINEFIDLMKALPAEDDLRNLLFGLAVIIHLQEVEPCDNPPLRTKPGLDLQEFKTEFHKRLDPKKTIAARVGSLIEAPGWNADDLDFVLVAPDFPTPMYKALAEQSQDWLLPGLEHVPPNTLSLLETNYEFIEAFMVGLNHEMSRELLWRGYPTDQRGTYFRQFWDPSGRFPPPKDEAERKANLEAGKDIPPIHEWRDEQLGSNLGKPRNLSGTFPTPVTKAQMVLLIRGDLLRRYPDAMIFAAKAEWSTDSSGNKQLPRNPTTMEKHPIFRGKLLPDVSFLGFDLDPTEAAGTEQPSNRLQDHGAGWFIVIQQQPTAPRYGLDETVATSNQSGWTWRDLAWPHVNTIQGNDYVHLASGLKSTFPSNARRGPQGETWKWFDAPDTSGTLVPCDSAQIACITLQEPVRVAIHASDLL